MIERADVISGLVALRTIECTRPKFGSWVKVTVVNGDHDSEGTTTSASAPFSKPWSSK